jgi:hypothetical protein
VRSRIDRDEAELRNVTQQLGDAERRQAEHEAALTGLGQTAQRFLVSI